MRIAVVIPVLNEAESLPELLGELQGVAAETGLKLDVVVIDDGSSDGSSEMARASGAQVLRSARNRGKADALQAGFDATWDYDIVITMDGDLQDDPAEIPRIVEALGSHDLVSGWKESRKDSWWRRVQSKLFSSAVRLLTGMQLHDFNCGFKGYRRTVLDDIRIYGDLHRLIPVLAHDAGYSVGEIPVHHRPRRHGRSRYGFGRALRGPLDLITVVFLARLGQRPLHAFGVVGGVLSAVGVGLGGYLTWIKFADGVAIGDRPLLLLAVLLIVLGVQIFGFGLVAEMILARGPQPPARYRPVGVRPQYSASPGDTEPLGLR